MNTTCHATMIIDVGDTITTISVIHKSDDVPCLTVTCRDNDDGLLDVTFDPPRGTDMDAVNERLTVWDCERLQSEIQAALQRSFWLADRRAQAAREQVRRSVPKEALSSSSTLQLLAISTAASASMIAGGC